MKKIIPRPVVSHHHRRHHQPKVRGGRGGGLVKGAVIVNGIVLSLTLAPRPQVGHTHVDDVGDDDDVDDGDDNDDLAF